MHIYDYIQETPYLRTVKSFMWLVDFEFTCDSLDIAYGCQDLISHRFRIVYKYIYEGTKKNKVKIEKEIIKV